MEEGVGPPVFGAKTGNRARQDCAAEVCDSRGTCYKASKGEKLPNDGNLTPSKDVAQQVQLLAENRSITGVNIVVDAGFSLGS